MKLFGSSLFGQDFAAGAAPRYVGHRSRAQREARLPALTETGACGHGVLSGSTENIRCKAEVNANGPGLSEIALRQRQLQIRSLQRRHQPG
jgi:hypothetical protein